MSLPLVFDSSAGPLRDREGSAAEMFGNLAATVRGGQWPAVDLRFVWLPASGSDPERAVYVAMRGIFERGEPLARCWSDPPMWRGAVSPDAAAGVLEAWKRGAHGELGLLRLPVPTVSSISANPRPSNHLTLLGHLGHDAFGLPPTWHFRYWHLTGYGSSPVGQGTTLSAINPSLRWTDESAEATFRYHAGFDLSRISESRFDAFLPSPYAVELGDEVMNSVSVRFYSRSEQLPPKLWAAIGSGPWDMRFPRFTGWSIVEGLTDWFTYEQGLAMPSGLDSPCVWVGTDDEPWFRLGVRLPAFGLAAQRRRAWQLLQDRQRPIAEVARMTSKDKKRNGAALLELGVGNALAAYGWQVVHGGAPLATEGIDLLALHEPTRRAIGLSVTLGNDIGEKLRRLLDARQELAPVLSEWDVGWGILTSLDTDNVVSGDIADCTRAGVSVFTGEVLRLVGDDLDAFITHVESQLKRDAYTRLLTGAAHLGPG